MHFLIYILVYPFLWLVSRLPFWLFYRVSDFLFFWVCNVFGYRKKIITNNLKLSFPEKSDAEIRKIRRKFYAYFCDTLLEVIKTFGISQKELDKRFKFKDLTLVRQMEQQNKSVVLLCSHFASWEWMIVLGTLMKHKPYGVYQPIVNPYFDRLIRSARAKFGAWLMTPRNTPNYIIENKNNHVLAMYGMVSDQSASWKRAQYWRDFMGVKVPVFVGAERLAKKYDLAVFYLKVGKVKRGFYEAELILLSENPKTVPDFEITDAYLNLLEQQIKQRPELYLWSHNRWKHKNKHPQKFAKVK
ncbi:MAG: lysophospholipid acyltransferase family protein [Flavobacteriaceae bacterium]|nr:lysophospholipid acyltransferase family protein [Flavobacteriaceae bacterium]